MTTMKKQTAALAFGLLAASGNAFAPTHNAASTFRATGNSIVNSAMKPSNIPLHAAGSEAMTPQEDEVARLKAMAAKLREEAASLESEQKKAFSEASERMFRRFDTDGNGELSLSELKTGLEKMFKIDIPDNRAQKLMKAFDANGDGALQLDEFKGADTLRNKLDAIVREEQDAVREQAKRAREQEEAAQLVEMQMELVNDKPATTSDKIVSVLPYLFPLLDGLSFARFFIEGNPENPLAIAGLAAYGLYRSIPFGGFLAFFALNFLSENLQINRLVRFNMQQAIYLDIALFVPAFLASVGTALFQATGGSIPPAVTELSSDAMFFVLLASVGYSAVSSLLGEAPNKLPLISQRVEDRMITPDMFDANGKFVPFNENGNPKNKDSDEKKN